MRTEVISNNQWQKKKLEQILNTINEKDGQQIMEQRGNEKPQIEQQVEEFQQKKAPVKVIEVLKLKCLFCKSDEEHLPEAGFIVRGCHANFACKTCCNGLFAELTEDLECPTEACEVKLGKDRLSHVKFTFFA